MLKKSVIITFISICIVLMLPFALEVFIFRNNVYSVLSNGEWGSFLGSYLGGMLGGVGTLLAVYITTKETRKIQKENSEQIKEETRRREKAERKQFADGIAKDVAVYIADISKYFYICHSLEQLHREKEELSKQLFDIMRKISEEKHYLTKVNPDIDFQNYNYIQNKLQKLEQEKMRIEYNKEDILKEIEQKKADRTIAIERYFLLKIKLQDIKCGKN